MASLMLARASCSSLPCEMQPGSAGHSTIIQPSSTGSIVTWKIIATLSIPSIACQDNSVQPTWLGPVVEDDLPALVGFFEHEGEQAVGRPAFLLGAVQVVLAEADGERVVQRMRLQFGKRDCSHGRACEVQVLVVFHDVRVAPRYLVADEEGVGRVLISLHEAIEVAGVPGFLLRQHHFGDVEFRARRGVESVILLRRSGSANGKQQHQCKCVCYRRPRDPRYPQSILQPIADHADTSRAKSVNEPSPRGCQEDVTKRAGRCHRMGRAVRYASPVDSACCWAW